MNESVRKDLMSNCNVEEFTILEKIILVVENTPERKQKDAIKTIIDEAIE